MSNMNCREIVDRVKEIRYLKDNFVDEMAAGNIEQCWRLKQALSRIIKGTIESLQPSLEILTKENLQKQYFEWQEMYRNLNPEYKLPIFEHIFEFLEKDPDFVELMKTKEKQGFVKMVLAPAPGFYWLRKFVGKVNNLLKMAGGGDVVSGKVFGSMLADESKIGYFGEVNVAKEYLPDVVDGKTAEQIKQNTDQFSICDGWMISFATEEKEIPRYKERPVETGNGRVSMRCNLLAPDYQDIFSGDNEFYSGEEPMIPQEFLALFARDIFEKYIKTGRKLDKKTQDFFGSETATWFISISTPGTRYLPTIRWEPEDLNLTLIEHYPLNSNFLVGVRSVVRKRTGSEKAPN